MAEGPSSSGGGGSYVQSSSEGELWREAAGWLTRCGLLRPDHRANWPASTIHDLAYTLRDGVLLCNLLNTIDPGCLDMKNVNQRPQMAQFLCLRNIKVFLNTCHKHFELREVDLFDASMLFDLTNFHRVLCTLAKLSHCPKAQRLNVSSRTKKASKTVESVKSAPATKTVATAKSAPATLQRPFSAQRTQSEEDIYKNLQSIEAEAEAASGGARGEGGVGGDGDAEWLRDEQIYHDLCAVRASAAHLRSRHAALAPSAGAGAAGGASGGGAGAGGEGAGAGAGAGGAAMEKRDYVIRELVDTEANYLDVLGNILRHFLRPLTPHLKPHDLATIFFGVKELHETHTGLLRALRAATEPARRAAPGPAPSLADVFLAWRERLLLYGDYCSNLTRAQDTLKALVARDDAFAAQLARCQKEHSDGRIQLRDILSVPMQRVLKYHLLLEKLVAETSSAHWERRQLERAREAMVDVAHYINEVKRDSEVLAVLRHVRDTILEWDAPLAEYGRLLLDGDVRVKAHDDYKVRARYAFLFDKVLVVCKPARDHHYLYRGALRLAEYRVEEAAPPGRAPHDARWAARFFLVRRSKGAAYTVYARSQDAARKWVAAIRAAIDNLEPAGARATDHKFVLHTFAAPHTCHHCSKYLKGRIFQGYLCGACGATAHKACIALSGRCGARDPPAPPLPAPPALGAPGAPAAGAGAAAEADALLQQYMWYAGELGREAATAQLARRQDGTYLVRVRPHCARAADTQYALSLKTDGAVKHMRICRKPIDAHPHYYLSESRFFRTVVELIAYYERTSLAENFVGLECTLRWPVRRVLATVLHEWSAAGSAGAAGAAGPAPGSGSSQLTLRAGSRVLVLSKEGDARGWWKGRVLDRGDNRSGYFPKECVREEPDCLSSLD